MHNIQHAELSPKRDNNTAIMEKVAIQLDSKTHWKAVNRVRMFHKVVNISNITSADRKALDQVFLAGNQFLGTRNNSGGPAKHHILPSDYTQRRKAMEYIFTGQDLTLQVLLENWNLVEVQHWKEYWDWFVTPDKEFLYFRVAAQTWN